VLGTRSERDVHEVLVQGERIVAVCGRFVGRGVGVGLVANTQNMPNFKSFCLGIGNITSLYRVRCCTYTFRNEKLGLYRVIPIFFTGWFEVVA
jgi:hypothetical protein